MNKIFTTLGVIALLGISGCAAPPVRDSAPLKEAIDQAESPNFGTIIAESHKAHKALDTANEIHESMQGQTYEQEIPSLIASSHRDIVYKPNRNDHFDTGVDAAARAMQHRQNAEAAHEAILQPLRDRISENERRIADHEERIRHLEQMHEMGESPRTVIYFDFGKSNVRDDEQSKVDEVASFLNEHQEYHVTLTGYTDTVGSAGANRHLATHRNRAVKQALSGKGVSVRHTSLVAIGEGDGPDETKDQENRRVEITLHLEHHAHGAGHGHHEGQHHR